MWHDLSAARMDSGDFIVPMVILVSFPVAMFFLCRRYVMAAYPSDEILQCDRSAVTISKMRWFDLSNSRWDTRSYALTDVEDLRYGAVASSRGVTVYGLRFSVVGRNERVLPGLNTRQAGVILDAMEGFGLRRGDVALHRKIG
jgi:hypothetical protein